MRGTYEIVSVAGGKEDSDAIFQILRAIADDKLKNDITLLNYYDEMPISYSGVNIDDCSGGALSLTVPPVQAVVIECQKQTIIKSRYFPSGLSVHAIAEYANSKKNYVILSRFAYAQVRAERRAAVRVKLQEYVRVAISLGDGEVYPARLVDISITGIRVTESSAPMPVEDDIFVDMTLMGVHMIVPAAFIRETANEEGAFQVFTIEPDRNIEVIISRLIYNREVEIIQTIKEQILQ